MKKLFYGALAAVALLATQSCGNKTENATDTDTLPQIDTLANALPDSLQLARQDSIAKADSLAKVETEAKTTADPAIDKNLKKFADYVRDIRDNYYDNGTFTPAGSHETYDEMVVPALELDKKLKAQEGNMNDEQKAKYNKLRNSIKDLL